LNEFWILELLVIFISKLPSLLPTYLLTYLPIAWSRVFLEKLIDSQLVKKFPAFYGTRNFFTAFPSGHHLSLSWTTPSSSHYFLPKYCK